MSLENLPESARAAWFESRDQVAGFLVHIGQKMFIANEGAKSGDSIKPAPRRIAFSAKEGGVIDIAYHLPYDPSGLAEAWSARTAIESSTGLRFLSERIAPGRSSPSNNVIVMTMTVPEPDSAENLSAILKETLAEFCLKDIEVSVDGQVIPPVWDGWERGMTRGNGRNYSIAMCNGIPVCRTEAPEGAVPGSGVIWFTTSSKDAFTPAAKDTLRDMAASLLTITAPTVAPGSGAIRTEGDDLSLEARLMAWGLSSMREVTSEWLSSLSPEDTSSFLSSVVSGETAYRLPDIHVLDRAMPVGPLSDEMSVFIDMWGGAARQAAKAAGMNSVRIGMCHGLSSWTKAADGAPVLYVDPDKAKNWSSQEMLSEAIYMLSGLREQEELSHGHKFDRARAVSDMFARADRDDDAYIALRKDLRSKMGQAAIILRDGVPDAAGIVPGLSDRLLKWAWPDQEIQPEIAATDICDHASIVPLPTPEPVREPVVQHAPRPAPEPEPTAPAPAEDATNGRLDATNGRSDATNGRHPDESNATIGRMEESSEATNGRVDATIGRAVDEVPDDDANVSVAENPQESANVEDAAPHGEGLTDWTMDGFSDDAVPDAPAPGLSPEEASDRSLAGQGDVPDAPEENQTRIRPVLPVVPMVDLPTLPTSRPRRNRPTPVVQSAEVASTPGNPDVENAEAVQAAEGVDLIDDFFFAGVGIEQVDVHAPIIGEESSIVPVPVASGVDVHGSQDHSPEDALPASDAPAPTAAPAGDRLDEIDMTFFSTNDLLGDFTSEAIAKKAEEASAPTPQARPVPVRLSPVRLTR